MDPEGLYSVLGNREAVSFWCGGRLRGLKTIIAVAAGVTPKRADVESMQNVLLEESFPLREMHVIASASWTVVSSCHKEPPAPDMLAEGGLRMLQGKSGLAPKGYSPRLPISAS